MWKIIDGSVRKKNQKQIVIIPWNRIWDAHAQKWTKWKFAMLAVYIPHLYHKALLVVKLKPLYSLCYYGHISWCYNVQRMFLWPSFIMYYHTRLWYFRFLNKIFNIVHYTLIWLKQKHYTIKTRTSLWSILIWMLVQVFFFMKYPYIKTIIWISRQGYSSLSTFHTTMYCW